MLSYKLSRSLTPYTRTGVAVTPDQTQAQARESDQCTSYYISIRKLRKASKGLGISIESRFTRGGARPRERGAQFVVR